MKLVMTLLVRDEEDILEHHLRYHLAQGVDHIIVSDHLSQDRTPEILADYAATGRVEVISRRDPGYYQSVWVTDMARRAAERHEADWVINSDADEFWWPSEGTLRDFFGTVAAQDSVLTVPRFDYPVVPAPGGLFYERLIYRDTEPVNSMGAPLSPKVCHRGDTSIEVAQGNHSARGDQLGPPSAQDGLEILHFPARDYEQFAQKIQNGGRAYEQTHNLSRSQGETWRKLYEAQQNGGFREAFGKFAPDEATREAMTASGRLVRDTKLWDWFARQADAPVSQSA